MLSVLDGGRNGIHESTSLPSEMNVWADGKAVLCCDDWNEEYAVGDLSSDTLTQVWHGEKLRAAREKHIAGRGAEVSICGKCNLWRESRGARLWS